MRENNRPDPTPRRLTASQAARRLGVSAKALRMYEAQGLVTPGRSAAGYRLYGPDDLRRCARIAGLRASGLGLAEIARVIDGDPHDVEATFTAHEARLRDDLRRTAVQVQEAGRLRAELARRSADAIDIVDPRDAAHVMDAAAHPSADLAVSFPLPWPWDGELFSLRGVRPLNYIVGPLGSGKTRLAERLAEVLPDASFLGLDRMDDASVTACADRLTRDLALAARIESLSNRLVDAGAVRSVALTALLVGLDIVDIERQEADGNERGEERGAESGNERMDRPRVVVVDMVEQGLPRATQAALIAHLRRHSRTGRRTLFLMTRSSLILDFDVIDAANEAVILCPANHSPPTFVDPFPGAPGYEAVASCLATPEVRARTAGVFAARRVPTATA